MMKRMTLIGAVATVAALVPAFAAHAAESCSIKILKTGEIQVAAKNVAANPRWGTTVANIGAPFFNEATCYDAGALKLKKCNLGNPSTLSGIVPPFNCTVCVGDDGPDDCCIFAKGCSPGMRIRDASFGPNDPRIEAVDVPDASTLRFTGVNLQIVNGSGDTGSSLDGTGNLIIGYNEQDTPVASRTGSHNVIVGEAHGWTSHSGAVLGTGNRILEMYSSVTGGAQNTANSYGAVVSGGYNNIVLGDGGAISGGRDHVVSATSYSGSISGGDDNTIAPSSITGSVSGGTLNTAGGNYSSVSGGSSNSAVGAYSSVKGGSGNATAVLSTYSTVAGGIANLANGNSAVIAGGVYNTTSGTAATVGGGAGVSATTNEFHAGRSTGFPTATEY